MAWFKKASPPGGKPIEPGIVARAGRAIADQLNSWFGPENPQPISAPAGTPPRALDYPTGYNINIQPRNLEAVSFQNMRDLADSFDLVRLCIETRKDQVARMPFEFRLKGKPGENKVANVKRAAKDDRIAKLNEFFRFPDKEHTWQQWVRMVLEDMLVLDAPVIAPIATADGSLWSQGKELFALEVIDGATVARKIDGNGRTPQPPGVAYQQIIKGIPAVDFTSEQLIYRPRNVRVHKFFGFSPVEQIIITINIGLRRQMHLLNYYTEGNIPEAIAQVPKEWSADQIQEFQDWFDAKLAGNSATKRRITFVPEVGTVQFTRDPKLKDTLDEWITRIVCYAFGLSPQQFVSSMNRATAETSVEQAMAEGLTPILMHLEDTLNVVIFKYFGFDDIEFKFAADKDQNAVEQAGIYDKFLRNGTFKINQVLEELGKEGIGPAGDRNLVYTASGVTPIDTAIENADNPPEPALGDPGAVDDDSAPNGNQPPVKTKEKKPKKTAKRDYVGYEANQRPSRK